MNGPELKRLIEAAGMTYRGLGREMGVSGQLISYYVRGDRRITEDFEARALPYLRARVLEKTQLGLQALG